MELNDLVKAFEESSAFPPLPLALPARLLVAAAAAEEQTEFTVVLPRRRQEGRSHQGRPCCYRPGPEGSQGPGRRRSEAGQEGIAKADAEALKKQLEDAGQGRNQVIDLCGRAGGFAASPFCFVNQVSELRFSVSRQTLKSPVSGKRKPPFLSALQ